MKIIDNRMWLCIDCTLLHANGEYGERPADLPEPLCLIPAGTDLAMGLCEEEHADTCTEDDRAEGCDCERDTFSTLRCEGCGDPHHGERWAFTLFARDNRYRTADGHTPPETHQGDPGEFLHDALRQARVWRETGTVVHPGTARAIASWYQSPGTHGVAFSAFASAGVIERELLASVDRELIQESNQQNKELLLALDAYLFACPDVCCADGECDVCGMWECEHEEANHEPTHDVARCKERQRIRRESVPTNGYIECACCGLDMIGNPGDHCTGCEPCHEDGEPVPNASNWHCFTGTCDGSGCTYPGECLPF